MIEFIHEERISGKRYEEFIEWACMRSDAILIVYGAHGECCGDYDPKILSIRELLKPFCIKEISRSSIETGSKMKWPFTIATVVEPSWPGNFRYVDYYRITEELKAFLLSVGSMQSWGYPNYPEDLAFFNEGTSWFGSCSHERMYGIYGKDPNDCSALDRMGIEYEIFESSQEMFYDDYHTNGDDRRR